mmetsp:Transcript_83538/g.226452  ORF Transcript_83538/g.226452 Transcript_83538/m.226452 type:complete len:225 (-) Transcript_83538:199-873(-)
MAAEGFSPLWSPAGADQGQPEAGESSLPRGLWGRSAAGLAALLAALLLAAAAAGSLVLVAPGAPAGTPRAGSGHRPAAALRELGLDFDVPFGGNDHFHLNENVDPLRRARRGGHHEEGKRPITDPTACASLCTHTQTLSVTQCISDQTSCNTACAADTGPSPAAAPAGATPAQAAAAARKAREAASAAAKRLRTCNSNCGKSFTKCQNTCYKELKKCNKACKER